MYALKILSEPLFIEILINADINTRELSIFLAIVIFK